MGHLGIQLFRERLSEKVHATNPKGIVGGFELTVFQRNLKEWQERPSAEAVEICLRVLKESNKSRFDSYSVRNSVLIIPHITFRDCRVHMFSDNLSRNSCIWNNAMTFLSDHQTIAPQCPMPKASFFESAIYFIE